MEYVSLRKNLKEEGKRRVHLNFNQDRFYQAEKVPVVKWREKKVMRLCTRREREGEEETKKKREEFFHRRKKRKMRNGI